MAVVIWSVCVLSGLASGTAEPQTAARPGYPAESRLPPEPSGYRLSDYRTPTPARLTDAVTVSDEEALALWEAKGTVFIDVMPRPERPANLPADTLWRQPERRNIPGSVWLANTGYGVLSPEMEAYYRNSLKRLTHGNLDKPILIYCLENCWMSWNAAKRALALGYRKVYWYPAGTDGWVRNDGVLEHAKPLPRGS